MQRFRPDVVAGALVACMLGASHVVAETYNLGQVLEQVKKAHTHPSD